MRKVCYLDGVELGYRRRNANIHRRAGDGGAASLPGTTNALNSYAVVSLVTGDGCWKYMGHHGGVGG
jgi:hypothetical protein